MNIPQIVLLGAPGAGKGTQAARLVELGYQHVSTGDLLRAEIAKASSFGNRLKEILAAGRLVDDDTVLELLRANLNFSKGAYIFDGFPRTCEQAKMLDNEILLDKSMVAIYLDVNLDELVARIVNRRSCADCNEIYNLVNKPPKNDGKCDKCGGSLQHRKDDNVDTVQNRMNVFKSEIDPILAYYDDKQQLRRVDASIDPQTTFSQIKRILEI